MFILFSLCFSFSVDEYTFNHTVETSANGRFLIELWNRWCDHCAKFKPVWENVSSFYQNDEKFTILDIDCFSNERLCRRLSKEGYPQVLWYEKGMEKPIVYTGPLNEENIASFIDKQVNFPMIKLSSKEEINKMLNVTRQGSVFVLEHKKDESELFDLLHKIAYEFRAFDCIFLSLEAPENRLYVYKSFNDIVVYENGNNYDSLYKFVDNNMFPLFPVLSGSIFELLQKKRMIAGMFFIDEAHYLEMKDIAESFDDRFKSVYANFFEGDNLRQFIGIKQEDFPAFLLIDLYNNRWLRFKGKIAKNEINEWIDSINLTNVKWEGPGNGLFSDFWMKIYEMKNNTPEIIACIITILIIAGFIAGYIYFTCFYTDDREKEKNKID